MNRLITLTTDFGLSDEYVGVMKGVILSHAPGARIVDLSHGIPPQDIGFAASIIYSSYRYFPKGTLHVIVVDPGVGSNRRIVLLSSEGQLFLAPDNGVLSMLLTKTNVDSINEVTCDHLFLSPISRTFHGRDIFAPVAAHLANGFSPDKVGPQLGNKELTTIDLPEVLIDQKRGKLTGSVVSVDHFGNLTTNIHRDEYNHLVGTDFEGSVTVSIKGQVIDGLQTAYSAVSREAPLAIFGSRDYLEIAVNKGNAARYFNASPGDQVTLSLNARKR